MQKFQNTKGQNKNCQNTNVTKYKCNKMQKFQNINTTKYKRTKYKCNKIQMDQNINGNRKSVR